MKTPDFATGKLVDASKPEEVCRVLKKCGMTL